MFPAGSMARTWTVCSPSVSPANVRGLAQATNAPPSIAHSNVLPASSDAKEKTPASVAEGSDGVETNDVSGASVSTVHACVAGVASVLPAGSIARTSSVWGPSVKPAKVVGVAQGAKPPPSRLHSNVEPASVLVNANAASGSLVTASGDVAMPVCGGMVSMTHVKLAGVGSAFPNASVATTLSV